MEPLLARLEGVGVIAGAGRSAVWSGVPAGRGLRRAGARSGSTARSACAAPTERAGDAASRCRVRLAEIADSLRLLGEWLRHAARGADLDRPAGRRAARASAAPNCCAARIWHWLRLDHGQIAAAFPSDPGWALWPLAEAAIAGAAGGGRGDDPSVVRPARLGAGSVMAALHSDATADGTVLSRHGQSPRARASVAPCHGRSHSRMAGCTHRLGRALTSAVTPPHIDLRRLRRVKPGHDEGRPNAAHLGAHRSHP